MNLKRNEEIFTENLKMTSKVKLKPTKKIDLLDQKTGSQLASRCSVELYIICLYHLVGRESKLAVKIGNDASFD